MVWCRSLLVALFGISPIYFQLHTSVLRGSCSEKGAMSAGTKRPRSVVVRTEFAVKMTCQACVESVRKSLAELEGVGEVEVDLDNQRVVVTGSAPPSSSFAALKSTGLAVVLRGQGGVEGQNLGCAVTILETNVPQEVVGLVRFMQLDEETCFIDVSLEGLRKGPYMVAVHTLGDLREGWKSTGPRYHQKPECGEESDRDGDVGVVECDESGSGQLLVEHSRMKVWDIIGRSVVLHEGGKPDGLGSGWGIVARSAGLFENNKKVCACTGRTLWEQAEFGNKL